ncbi:MAG: CapA family protein [Oscillospiraceae bacterium]|nr:CapA family protein [Oscillospiraceae bacterium]
MKKIYALILSAALIISVSGCRTVEDAVPASATVSETVLLSETETALLPQETETPVTTVTEPTEPPEPPAPEYLTVSFAVTGDNLIHSSIYNQAQERAGGEGYDFAYAYENIVPIIKEADAAVINQETLICNDVFAPSTYPMFNSPVALGDHMLDIGFDVFTIANNHTLDKGTEGLSACLDYWDSRPEAVVCGAYRNAEDKADIRVKSFGGIDFSFLSYTESLNGLSLPAGSELIIGNLNDIEGMEADIAAAKEVSDICVVALHWGVENSDVISDYQRIIANRLAEAGADIIIGNHPHVLRDIEEIGREDGSVTLCAYSLGNFISAQSVGQNLIGGVLKFDVSLKADRTEAPVFENIEFVPVITHYEGSYRNVKLYPLDKYTRELAESHGVKSMSKFGYDYIFEILKKNINEKYLDTEKYYKESGY